MKWVLLIIVGFVVLFFLLLYVMEIILMGMVYVVWIGIGIVGGVFVGIFFYKELKDVKWIFFIVLILCLVVGLKILL